MGNLVSLPTPDGSGFIDLSRQSISSIPPSVKAIKGNWKEIKAIDLSYNSVSSLPADVGRSDIRMLRLVANELLSIPENLSKLKNIEEIDLSVNFLSEFSISGSELLQLSKLASLELWWNSLVTLPPAFSSLTLLQSLNLAHNHLLSLPEDFKSLTELSDLNISGNLFTKIPASVAALPNLRRLDCALNRLETLPKQFACEDTLEILFLQHNRLTHLSPSVGSLKKLKKIDVAHNKLERLVPSRTVLNLKNLRELYLDRNGLISLPSSIGNLTALRKIDISENKFAALPKEMSHCTSLSVILAAKNRLNTIPASLSSLPITDLVLSSNAIETFPAVICSLSKLVLLDLGSNRIASIPEGIKNLASLRQLCISENRLTEVPAGIFLPSLVFLNLFGNKISSLPPKVNSHPSSLRFLHLGFNSLGGTFPPWFSRCSSSLVELTLVGNPSLSLDDVPQKLRPLLVETPEQRDAALEKTSSSSRSSGTGSGRRKKAPEPSSPDSPSSDELSVLFNFNANIPVGYSLSIAPPPPTTPSNHDIWSIAKPAVGFAEILGRRASMEDALCVELYPPDPLQSGELSGSKKDGDDGDISPSSSVSSIKGVPGGGGGGGGGATPRITSGDHALLPAFSSSGSLIPVSPFNPAATVSAQGDGLADVSSIQDIHVGVFDGHSGDAVAKYVAKSFVKALLKQSEKKFKKCRLYAQLFPSPEAESRKPPREPRRVVPLAPLHFRKAALVINSRIFRRKVDGGCCAVVVSWIRSSPWFPQSYSRETGEIQESFLGQTDDDGTVVPDPAIPPIPAVSSKKRGNSKKNTSFLSRSVSVGPESPSTARFEESEAGGGGKKDGTGSKGSGGGGESIAVSVGAGEKKLSKRNTSITLHSSTGSELMTTTSMSQQEYVSPADVFDNFSISTEARKYSRPSDSATPQRTGVISYQEKEFGKSELDISALGSETYNPRGRLFIANTGDCRAVVSCAGGVAKRLSVDHKPMTVQETMRIKSNMGIVTANGRVNGIVAVPRAFGDFYLAPYVIVDPHVTVYDVREGDEFVICACDGLWDVLSDQEACDIAKKIDDPGRAAEALVQIAYLKNCTDNVTCVVLRLDSGKKGFAKATRGNSDDGESFPEVAKPSLLGSAASKIVEESEEGEGLDEGDDDNFDGDTEKDEDEEIIKDPRKDDEKEKEEKNEVKQEEEKGKEASSRTRSASSKEEKERHRHHRSRKSADGGEGSEGSEEKDEESRHRHHHRSGKHHHHRHHRHRHHHHRSRRKREEEGSGGEDNDENDDDAKKEDIDCSSDDDEKNEFLNLDGPTVRDYSNGRESDRSSDFLSEDELV